MLANEGGFQSTKECVSLDTYRVLKGMKCQSYILVHPPSSTKSYELSKTEGCATAEYLIKR